MQKLLLRLAFFCLLFSFCADAQRSPYVTPKIRTVVQGRLISPGSPPFHLVATLTKADVPFGRIEMHWLAPDKWRRVIDTPYFKQTKIVNGERIFEQNSWDYFPLAVETLIIAMVDPDPIIAAVREGDRVSTKSNGDANESGVTCYDKFNKLCFKDKNGLREIVAASGHAVDFSQYEKFHSMRIAREISNAGRLGETRLTLKIMRLEDLKKPDEMLFHIESPTPPEKQLKTMQLDEIALRHQLIGPAEIIWPQPLDGQQTGPASFYISTDQAGRVREVQQLYTVNERTNDSAKSQLQKWTFKPLVRNGVPLQMQGVLSFTLDTRAYGPKEPLSDVEARKLATYTRDCGIPAGKYPAGTTYDLWIAVDSEGRLIEVMTGKGPHELFSPCYDALKQWKFSPLMQNGKALPYRANIVFTMP
ncbi:MAG: hypothetical protein JSS87_15530 [Acidobacteria bacterium]|nr:hypothetical protein [Acidobacteriota bacterium]